MGRSLTREDRIALADKWRERAARLEAYAARMRNQGDPREAADADEAAADYYREADELEMGQ